MKINIFLTIVICLLNISFFHGITYSNDIGVKELQYTDTSRLIDLCPRILNVVVWYPINSLGHTQKKIVRDIWYLHDAAKDSPILSEDTKLPLILFSHGYGCGPYQNSWLPEMLASHGYIVASVEHYGNSYENVIVEVSARPWNRPADMSIVLDQLLQEPFFADRIDANRIGAAGFSQGGMTTLWLAGVKADLVMEKVSEKIKSINDPAWKAAHEGITNKDLEHANKSYHDGRIKAVFAIAPGLDFHNQMFTAQGLLGVTIPVYIVATESDYIVSVSQHAQFFADNLKNAHLTIVPGKGTHWIFMNEVTAQGKEAAPFIMVGKELVPIITVDDSSISRSEIHEHVGIMAIDFFNTYLP